MRCPEFPSRLEENLGGALIAFATDALADLSTTASKVRAVGDRLPKAYLDLIEK